MRIFRNIFVCSRQKPFCLFSVKTRVKTDTKCQGDLSLTRQGHLLLHYIYIHCILQMYPCENTCDVSYRNVGDSRVFVLNIKMMKLYFQHLIHRNICSRHGIYKVDITRMLKVELIIFSYLKQIFTIIATS